MEESDAFSREGILFTFGLTTALAEQAEEHSLYLSGQSKILIKLQLKPQMAGSLDKVQYIYNVYQLRLYQIPREKNSNIEFELKHATILYSHHTVN